MSSIKIIRNGNPKEDDVVFSVILRWVAGIAAVIVAGLLVSGILALFRNAEETHDNTIAMKALTTKMDAFIETSRAQWEKSQAKDEELRIGQEALKRRMTALDKKLD